MLTLPKLIQTILKGSLTNFSDSKVVSGLNVTGHYHAFGKKRKLIESDHLSSLLQFVRDDLYPKNIFKNRKGLYAIDGSKLKITIQNSKCPTAGLLLSTLYDVEHRIPIDVELYAHTYERVAMKNHLKHIPRGSGSTVLVDRGYYSSEMVAALHALNIHGVFRMKKDSNCTKPLIADSTLTKHRTTLNGVPDYAYNVERPIKNKKDGESYYFASDRDMSG